MRSYSKRPADLLPGRDDVQMLSCKYRARTSPLHYNYKQRAAVVLLPRHDTSSANNNPSSLPASLNIQPVICLPGRFYTWENSSCVSTDMMRIILCFTNYVHNNVHANILMCCIVREVIHMSESLWVYCGDSLLLISPRRGPACLAARPRARYLLLR